MRADYFGKVIGGCSDVAIGGEVLRIVGMRGMDVGSVCSCSDGR